MEDVLKKIAEIVVEKYVTEKKSDQSLLEYPVSLSGMIDFISRSFTIKTITNINTCDYGTSYNNNIVVCINWEDREWFIVWTYTRGTCSYCDEDTSISLKSSDFSREETIQLFADDLRCKIIHGHIYESLQELVVGIKNLKDQELVNGLISVVPELQDPDTNCKEDVEKSQIPSDACDEVDENEIPSDACEEANGYPEPSVRVMQLISKNVSVPLRTILNAMGHGQLSTDRGQKLGMFLKDRLPKRERSRTVLHGTNMRVLLYEVDEIGLISHLINKWIYE